MISPRYNSSQIFIVDLITATVLLVISVVIFFSYYSLSSPDESLYDTALELSTSFSSTQINSLNNDYIRTLFVEQKINDIDNTLFQQISDFHIRGMSEDAENLTREITELFVTEQIGYTIILDDFTLETELISSSLFGSKSQARNVAVIERQIIGIENSTPYIHIYTIEVWRQ